jgi:hypothetical protein
MNTSPLPLETDVLAWDADNQRWVIAHRLKNDRIRINNHDIPLRVNLAGWYPLPKEPNHDNSV